MNFIKAKELPLPICGFFLQQLFPTRYSFHSSSDSQHFLHYKITLLTHLVCFVVLMCLRVVCVLCGAISFFSPEKLLLKRLNFRIHGVLEFREQSTHIFIATLKIYKRVYISMCPCVSPWILCMCIPYQQLGLTSTFNSSALLLCMIVHT